MRLTWLLLPLACFAQDDSHSLTYLDENNPYYPGLRFPTIHHAAMGG